MHEILVALTLQGAHDVPPLRLDPRSHLEAPVVRLDFVELLAEPFLIEARIQILRRRFDPV